MKNIRIFIGKLSVFGGEIFYIYLNKRVFVLSMINVSVVVCYNSLSSVSYGPSHFYLHYIYIIVMIINK